MSLKWIGPVELIEDGFDSHGDPTFSASPDFLGGQGDLDVGGSLTWDQAHQLREMFDNPALRQTVGRTTGVLLPLWFDDELLDPMSGWYVVSAFTMASTQQHSLSSSGVPVSFKASFLEGGAVPVLVHSSAQMPNDFGIVGESVVPDPFGPGAVLGPEGVPVVYRECDTAFPHDTGRDTEPLA